MVGYPHPSGVPIDHPEQAEPQAPDASLLLLLRWLRLGLAEHAIDALGLGCDPTDEAHHVNGSRHVGLTNGKA